MNKKMTKFAGIGLAAALLLTGCGNGNGGGTYATVDGKAIPQDKYDAQLKLYKNILAAQYQLPVSISNSLIQETVMMSDLEKNKVSIPENEYKVEYEKAIETYGGPEAYQQALKQLDVTDQEMRDSLKYETISRIHHEWFTKNHMPSDAEMKKYFEDNKNTLVTVDSSHILVKTEEEAKKVKERLAKGEKFEDIAKEVSTDKGSAVKGGALGEQTADAFVPEFSKALEGLKEGQISEPVKSEYGYHIIRVNKKNDSFESKKKEIAEQLTGTAYSDYIQDLMKKAKVEIKGQEAKVDEGQQSGEPEKADQSQPAESQQSSK